MLIPIPTYFLNETQMLKKSFLMVSTHHSIAISGDENNAVARFSPAICSIFKLTIEIWILRLCRLIPTVYAKSGTISNRNEVLPRPALLLFEGPTSYSSPSPIISLVKTVTAGFVSSVYLEISIREIGLRRILSSTLARLLFFMKLTFRGFWLISYSSFLRFFKYTIFYCRQLFL